MGDEGVVSGEMPMDAAMPEPREATPGGMGPGVKTPGDAPLLNEQMPCGDKAVPENEPGTMDAPPFDGPRPDVPQGVVLMPTPEGLIDPSMLDAHPLTEHMPVKSEPEYEALKESIRLNGLQQPLTRFEGKILDGRHRLRACRELGIPVAVLDFVGSRDDAWVYVLQSNQYHHDYGTGQRAAVAALLEPEVADRPRPRPRTNRTADAPCGRQPRQWWVSV